MGDYPGPLEAKSMIEIWRFIAAWTGEEGLQGGVLSKPEMREPLNAAAISAEALAALTGSSVLNGSHRPGICKPCKPVPGSTTSLREGTEHVPPRKVERLAENGNTNP